MRVVNGDERRLAGVRQPDQSDVGDELQLDEELALFAGIAVLGEAGGLAGGGGEVLVAPAAAATLGDEHALAVVGEIGDDVAAFLVADDRPDRLFANALLDLAYLREQWI